MLSVSKLAVLAAAAAGAMPGAHAFFRMGCSQPLTVERADPIVNPGIVASHLHQVLGGDVFSFNQSFADARRSTCSTCQARADLSNYWTPNLYYRGQNGSFHNVGQSGGGTIYYLQRRGTANEKLNAFPEGFRMLAGNPMLRSFDAKSLEQRAVSFVCLDFAGSGAGGQFNEIPGHNCPNGLRAQIFFPSCWNGKDLDSPDHKSHMAYPNNVDSGSCPSTHPVRLISIFYEITFDVNAWKDQWWTPAGASHPFVLSMGDPTGYGFHGDFLNGWDVAALQRAIDGCTQDSGVIEDCQSILPLRTNQEMNDCVSAPRVAEKIAGWIPSLPGCNPVTSGPANAKAVSGCSVNSPILSPNQASFLRSDIAGWQPVGCARDDGPQRVLGAERWTPGSMTVDKCTAHCKSKGYAFAGLEWAQECWCDNKLDESKVGNYACDMPCEGDESTFCGASQRLAVYKAGNYSPPPAATLPPPQQNTGVVKPPAPTSQPAKPTYTTQPPPKETTNPAKPAPTTAAVSGFTSLGCFVDSQSARTLRGTALFSAGNMTPATCASRCKSAGFKFAGVEYGKECFCGNEIVNQKKVADGDCSTACAGDAKARCGAGNRINIYQAASSTSPAKPAPTVAAVSGFNSLGCFVDPTNARTLRGTALFRADNMTPAVCTARCKSQGFKFAGVEYGQECFCGNEIVNQKKAADAECSTACAGDAKARCGAGNRVNIYQSTAATSVQPVSWSAMGCFTDAAQARVLAGTGLWAGAPMTPAVCTARCASLGYKLAGVEYGKECYCGNALASSAKKVDAGQCNMACSGDSKQKCGAGNRIQMFQRATNKRDAHARRRSSATH
ncbi:WSC-domain-containing protein [Auricularia subglabra TFB-10046 SS5]|nr:WSC-domain-containing protein [Auricularia subglabra TFB-10046 SS5]